ncbi:MAG: hypothetical protein KJO95_08160 [Gammaproteobacteria bacterium]|nr:hypothetical protein [Gammaproteobacteria bacterium]
MDKQAKQVEPPRQPVQPRPASELEASVPYVEALMSGAEAPPNEYSADLLGDLKETSGALAQLSAQIERLAADLETAKTRRIALSGIAQKLGVTLYRWRGKGKPNGG